MNNMDTTSSVIVGVVAFMAITIVVGSSIKSVEVRGLREVAS
jgi:hypothetical protein